VLPKLETIRSRTFELLNPATFGDQTSRLWDQFFSLLILLNVIAVTLESVEKLHEKYERIFHSFELFSILIFTVEYLLRVWVAPLKYENDSIASYSARIKYVFSLNGIIDLLSIIPFYLQFMLPGLDLRILRTLRLLRILKLSTYNSALSDLIEAIREERRSFIAAGYIFVVMFIIASSLIYFAEHQKHPTHFNSIPDSMYWALITLTTVGYGDVTPITALGKLISVISAMGGVVVVALLTGIIASSFSLQMERRKAEFEDEIRDALKDGILDEFEVKHIENLRKHFGISKRKTESLIKEISGEKPLKG
jgi:voltage-gated potassium channel